MAIRRELVIGIDKFETSRLLRALRALPAVEPPDVFRHAAWIASPQCVAHWCRGDADRPAIRAAWHRRMESSRALRCHVGVPTLFLLTRGLLVVTQTRTGTVEWQYAAVPDALDAVRRVAEQLVAEVVVPYVDTWQDGSQCRAQPSATLIRVNWDAHLTGGQLLDVALAIAMVHEPTPLMTTDNIYGALDNVVRIVRAYIDYAIDPDVPDYNNMFAQAVDGEIARSILVQAGPLSLFFPSSCTAHWLLNAHVPRSDVVVFRHATGLVLLPLNSGGHWTLLAYHPRVRFVHFESLAGGSSHQAVARQIARWLMGPDEPVRECPAGAGQTQREAECGLYTLATAALLLRTADIEAVMAANNRRAAVMTYYASHVAPFKSLVTADQAYATLLHGLRRAVTWE